MRFIPCFGLAVLLAAPIFAADSTSAPLPPLPSDLPVELNQFGQTRVRRPVTNIVQQRRITLPQFPQARVITNNVARPAVPAMNPDEVLAWDASLKEYTAKAGDTAADFTFTVTNIATTNVVINWVRPSCGCTVAKLPPTPWTLKPGESGNVDLTLDLKGKSGTLFKYISIDTSHGQKMLNIRVTIPNDITVGGMDGRVRNMQLAMADRQIVFRGDCAKCHSAPLAGKTKGEDIYNAGCVICHDTPNRATMVPDLHAVANPGTKEYWQVWIRHGKPGTLMPAFAQGQGGPMTEEQIENLSVYLTEKFPARAPATVGATNALPVRPLPKPVAQVPAPAPAVKN